MHIHPSCWASGTQYTHECKNTLGSIGQVISLSADYFRTPDCQTAFLHFKNNNKRKVMKHFHQKTLLRTGTRDCCSENARGRNYLFSHKRAIFQIKVIDMLLKFFISRILQIQLHLNFVNVLSFSVAKVTAFNLTSDAPALIYPFWK